MFIEIKSLFTDYSIYCGEYKLEYFSQDIKDIIVGELVILY